MIKGKTGRCAEAGGPNKDKNHVQQEKWKCEEITEVVREHEILEKIGSEFQDSSWVTEAKIKVNAVENVDPQ